MRAGRVPGHRNSISARVSSAHCRQPFHSIRAGPPRWRWRHDGLNPSRWTTRNNALGRCRKVVLCSPQHGLRLRFTGELESLVERNLRSEVDGYQIFIRQCQKPPWSKPWHRGSLTGPSCAGHTPQLRRPADPALRPAVVPSNRQAFQKLDEDRASRYPGPWIADESNCSKRPAGSGRR